MDIENYIGRWFVDGTVPTIGEIWELYLETIENPDEYDMTDAQVLSVACDLLGMDYNELAVYIGAVTLYVNANGYRTAEGVNRIFSPTFGKEL